MGDDGKAKQLGQNRALLWLAVRHLAKDPKANPVVMGDSNEGQPVGNRSPSQLAKVASSPGLAIFERAGRLLNAAEVAAR